MMSGLTSPFALKASAYALSSYGGHDAGHG